MPKNPLSLRSEASKMKLKSKNIYLKNNASTEMLETNAINSSTIKIQVR